MKEGNEPIGRPIKMNFNEMGCESLDSINFVQDMDQWRALVNA